jgi:hypothetical protein
LNEEPETTLFIEEGITGDAQGQSQGNERTEDHGDV